MYCGSDYGLDTAKEDEEAVLPALTSKFPDLPLSDVEVVDVAWFCEAKQDYPCLVRCPKERAERGKPPGDGDDHPMGKEVMPAGLGGGHGPDDVGSLPEAVGDMRVDEHRGFLPMVVHTFSPPLPPSPLATLPRYATPLAEVQQLQENFDKLWELLTHMSGNVENMNACVGEPERKGEGSFPQIGKNKDEIQALGVRVRELELFTVTLAELVHSCFNIRITEFERYLVSHGFQLTMAPARSTSPPTRTSLWSSVPSAPRPSSSEEPPRARVPPVPSRPAPVHLPDVAPGPAFVPSSPYSAPE